MFKKKFRKTIYKVLTVISCQMKALNSFTNAHDETHRNFSQRLDAIGLQQFSKTSKSKSKFH